MTAKHRDAYLRAYTELGWDALAVAPPTLHLWLPAHAEALARRVATMVQRELRRAGPRPVVISAFSGAAKACYYRLLTVLLDGSFTDVRDCLCGQCFDSGPVDFISRNGVKFLAPPTTSSRATRSAAAAAADALDAVLGARFARERSELWAVLRRAEALPQTAPTLFVYSADDELAPVEVIETFAAALRDAGRPVRMQRWDRSEHVGHLRQHPVEYIGAVAGWLDEARRSWVDSRDGVVRRLASRL